MNHIYIYIYMYYTHICICTLSLSLSLSIYIYIYMYVYIYIYIYIKTQDVSTQNGRTHVITSTAVHTSLRWSKCPRIDIAHYRNRYADFPDDHVSLLSLIHVSILLNKAKQIRTYKLTMRGALNRGPLKSL